MDRYSRLIALPQNLYIEDSPVMIPAGALLKDNKNRTIVLQLKFRNLVRKSITAIVITVRTYDTTGKELEGIPEYQYLDLCGDYGAEFGSRQAIELPDANTRNVQIIINKVIFADHSVWAHSDELPLMPLSSGTLLNQFLTVQEELEQYQLETSEAAKFIPTTCEDLWQCTCGQYNKVSEENCVCGLGYSHIKQALDIEQLKRDAEIRLQAEKEQKETAERIRIAEAKRKKRITTIIAAAAALIIAGTLITTKVIIPAVKYHQATVLLENEHFDLAADAFKELDNYKNSEEMVSRCYQQKELKQTEDTYHNAMLLLEQGKYDEAGKAFHSIRNYRDAQTQEKECVYQKGDHLLEEKNYSAAIEIFSDIPGYKDASAKENEACYLYADSLIKNKQFSEARQQYKASGRYKDAAAKYDAVPAQHVKYINHLLSDGKYAEAESEYRKLEGHEVSTITDSDFMIQTGNTSKNVLDSLYGDDFNWFCFDPVTDSSKRDVIETHRGIHIGDHKIAVLLAYGDESEGNFATNCRFYDGMRNYPQRSQQIINECDTYLTYDSSGLYITFYFDSNDLVSWIVLGKGAPTSSHYIGAYGGV